MAGFRKHDMVILTSELSPLGAGTLQKVLANDILRGIRLGDDRVAVVIDDVYDSDEDIPYPIGNIVKMRDAKDSIVLWDKAKIKPWFASTSRDEMLFNDNVQTPMDREGNVFYSIPDSQQDANAQFDKGFEDDFGVEGVFEAKDFILRPTNDSGEDGDEVQLLMFGSIIGRGIVHHVDPKKTCHNAEIGIHNISVRIVQVHVGHENDPLPFPHAGADTVGESIGVPVRWARKEICPMGVTTSAGGSEQVCLYLGTKMVARAILCDDVDHKHMGQIERLEDDQVFVKVIEVLEQTEALPFPTKKCYTLGEVFHLQCITWKAAFVVYVKDPIAVHEDPKIFSVGDEIHLQINGINVARGEVFRTHPLDKVHNISLGFNRISIHVLQAFHSMTALPYPSAGANTIGEAIGSYVIWDVVDVCEVNEPFDDDIYQCVYNEDDKVQNSSIEDDEYISHDDFTDRSKWHLKDVEIFNGMDRTTVLAFGSITAWSPLASINNEEVGEDHVGVLVQNLVCDEMTRQQLFPTFVEGYPCLVKWPILSLKLVICNQFIVDILATKQDENDDDNANVENNESVHNPSALLLLEYEQPKRRHYSMHGKRKAADPNAQQKRRFEKRIATQCSEAKVREVFMTRCVCGNNCCQTFPRDHILELRQEYYGMDNNAKLTQIFSYFENREESVARSGQFVLKGKVICKQAFWTILGIAKSTFYGYEKDYNNGCKVGWHGNKGTKKSRMPTMEFCAQLEALLKTLGEPMPHLKYSGIYGTSQIIYKLPSCYNKQEIYDEVAQILTLEGQKPIAHAAFYKLWRENFANYSFHSRQAFAKCEVCTTLKELLMKEKRTEVRKIYERQREKHMQEQMSRRALYYAARVMAKKQPQDHLCIIHDKMDQGKTGIPKLLNTLKSMASGCKPLPMALTGMITHGWEPGVFAHFSLTGLWPSDPDFTITSIIKCLRDLESYSGDKSGDLLFVSQEETKPLFSALLDKPAFEIGYLKEKKHSMDRFHGNDNIGASSNAGFNSSIQFKQLPKHFHLQMDNSAKDNKNQTMIAFASELVKRGIFETVTLCFLMVGHTHEDIDALFSRVSTRINHREIMTLLGLMAEVWECEAVHPVPYLIQEVADYKFYIKDFVKPIKGQSVPMAFRFFMKNNVPIFQTKEDINSSWSPHEGVCIWKEDIIEKQLKFPTGEPKSKVLAPMYKRADDVLPYITHYVDWLKKTWKDESSSGYVERLPLIQYWSKVAKILSNPLSSEGETSQPLANGFWPRTNHGTGYKVNLGTFEETGWKATSDIVELETELENEIEEGQMAFVGPSSERERDRFIPLQDIVEGVFIFIRPTDEFEKNHPGHFWMARAVTEVETDRSSANLGEFKLQWWRPKYRGYLSTEEDHKRYEDCLEKSKTWECDPLQEEQWLPAKSAFLSWTYRGKTVEKGLKIPSKMLEAIKIYIERARIEDLRTTKGKAIA